MVREPDAGRPVEALEPRQRRVQRDGAALREPHHGDPRGIDPRVRGQELQGPVGIPDHRLAAELRLVLRGAGDAPAREAIEDERRGAGLAKLLGPSVLAGAYPPGAVNEHDGRAPLDPPRGKLEVPPDQAGGGGPDPLEELRYRRRGGLEADAAGRPGRERRVERGWRTAVHVAHRRRARDFLPVGEHDAQRVPELGPARRAFLGQCRGGSRTGPGRRCSAEGRLSSGSRLSGPVRPSQSPRISKSFTAARPPGSPRYENPHWKVSRRHSWGGSNRNCSRAGCAFAGERRGQQADAQNARENSLWSLHVASPDHEFSAYRG